MLTRPSVARWWHGTIAVSVLFALMLQAVIAARAPGTPPGHAVGTLAGAPVASRFVRFLSFFTVQSNILSGIVSAQLAARPQRDGGVWRAVRLAALVGITVTGVVYSTVLARVHEPKGWDQVVSNIFVHYVVPIMMVLGWVLFGPRPRIDLAVICRAAVWPVAWLVYTLIHGEVSKWYPYPFLDVPTHGYGRVTVNIVGVLVVFAIVASLYRLGDRRLPATDVENVPSPVLRPSAAEGHAP
ncbi:MAG: Pr6Pr family membrane protein [Jatrophihabitans sp.]|uniref:Pr6Pr family membrane protein n=1 Tax=Jatrophihabitans sp. TaxID=1932789 RepID=UPI003F821E2E